MKKQIFIFCLLFNIFCNGVTVKDQHSLAVDVFQKQLEFCERLKNPKDVAECKHKILSSLVKQNNTIQNNETNKKKTNDDSNSDNDNTSEILATFADMVTNFGRMVTDPKNPANVGLSICNMFAGMINIIATATKRMHLNKEDTEQIIEKIDQKTKESIKILRSAK